MNTLTQKIKHYNLNMFYSCGYSYEAETNWRIQQVMNDFVQTYKDKFETHTFILDYKDDIISMIAYKLLKAISGVNPFNLVLYGKKKKTKEMLSDEQKIVGEFGLRKLAKKGNLVFISAFNPLYQVVNKVEIFKHFDLDFKCWFNVGSQSFETYNIVERFLPAHLRLMRVFYHVGFIKGDFFDDKQYEEDIIHFQDWCDNNWVEEEDGRAWGLYDYPWISAEYDNDYIKVVYLTENIEDDKILLQSVQDEDCIVNYSFSGVFDDSKEKQNKINELLKQYSLYVKKGSNITMGDYIPYANFGRGYEYNDIGVNKRQITIHDIKEDAE